MISFSTLNNLIVLFEINKEIYLQLICCFSCSTYCQTQVFFQLQIYKLPLNCDVNPSIFFQIYENNTSA